jgi:stage V sporulation protein G
MQITDVQVKLVNGRDPKLRAFCSMTVDHEFVVRDIKIIERDQGHFVAMPARKMSHHCSRCGTKNHLRARFCNNCAAPLPDTRARKDPSGRMKLHADIAHPINADCRQRIQETVLEAFRRELELSLQPGYRPKDLGDEGDDETL